MRRGQLLRVLTLKLQTQLSPGHQVKCCLAVIDSQKLCGLNCSRERWLLQELPLANTVQ